MRHIRSHLPGIFGAEDKTDYATNLGTITTPAFPEPIKPETPERDLTTAERDFLTGLLRWAGEVGVPFLPQVPTLSVTNQCTCGCPTIGLVGDTSLRVLNPRKDRFIVDAIGDSNGAMVGIMLFQAGGMLSELEIYALGDIPNRFPLPALSSLHRPEEPTPTER